MPSTDGTGGGKQEVQSRIAHSVLLLVVPFWVPGAAGRGAGYGFCGAVCGVVGASTMPMSGVPVWAIAPSLHHKL